MKANSVSPVIASLLVFWSFDSLGQVTAILGSRSISSTRLPFLPTKTTLTSTTATILRSRGGEQTSNDPYNPDQHYLPNPNEPNGYYPQPYENEMPFQHEPVQQRVDRWRQEQLSYSQSMTPEDEANPRDAQGRVKLLASVSRGGRALIFFLLMWRDVHLLEVADMALKGKLGGRLRMFGVIPLSLLFLANMIGVVCSLQFLQFKKAHMKAILNLDKTVEILLLIWYFIRMTVYPSKYVPREKFISDMLHSVFFLIQCQAFTRVTWDEVRPGQPSALGQDLQSQASSYDSFRGPPPGVSQYTGRGTSYQQQHYGSN
eukprot:Nitzschia sp. Nitz4//scaffold1_size375055//319368//320405//NITZ4_000329-RA/size375055-augustus-gene-0.694-mRNA-1//1//CDS//3329541204//4717//frame0